MKILYGLIIFSMIFAACSTGEASKALKLDNKPNTVVVETFEDAPLSNSVLDCYESDNGNIFVKGINYAPKNLNTWGFADLGYDYCVKSESKTLHEAQCGSSNEVICDNGCFNGRCTQAEETCQEGWYCDGMNARAYLNFDCTWNQYEYINSTINGSQAVCQNGQAVPKTSNYVDEDGADKYTFGYVYDVANNEPIRYDYCVGYSSPSRQALVEYYGLSSSRSVSCENGCFQGRCTQAEETCQEGWYCYNIKSRYYVSSECIMSDFESVGNEWDEISEPYMCSDGEFVSTCGDGLCQEFFEEDCNSCASDCGKCVIPPNPFPDERVYIFEQ